MSNAKYLQNINVAGNDELLSFRLGLGPIQYRQINTYNDNIEVGPNYTQVPKYFMIQIGFSYPVWRNPPLLS